MKPKRVTDPLFILDIWHLIQTFSINTIFHDFDVGATDESLLPETIV